MVTPPRIEQIKTYVKEKIKTSAVLMELIDNDENRIITDSGTQDDTLPGLPCYLIETLDNNKEPLCIGMAPPTGITTTLNIYYATTIIEGTQSNLEMVDEEMTKLFANDRTLDELTGDQEEYNLDFVIKSDMQKSSLSTFKAFIRGSPAESALTFPLRILFYAAE